MRPADSEYDVTQIALTDEARKILADLKNAGHVADMRDAFRLGVAVAIAIGAKPSLRKEGAATGGGRTTMYSASTVDPDGSLRTVVLEFYPEFEKAPNRVIQDLAEQGLAFIAESISGDDFRYRDVLERVKAISKYSQTTDSQTSVAYDKGGIAE